MKRLSLVVAVLSVLSLLSGCSAAAGPSATAAATYTSRELDLTFTVPESWAGKYRVVEGSGSLTVYFSPSQAPDPNVGDGELFCIIRKTAEIDTTMYDNAREIDIFSGTFIWGEPTDVRYQRGQPEYDIYASMQRDLPAICDSVCATPCKTFQPVQ